MNDYPHLPVMLPQILAHLQFLTPPTIIDATYGDGHYSQAFLDRGACVFAFDCDPEAIEKGRMRQEQNRKQGNKMMENLTLIHGNFQNMLTEMQTHPHAVIDAIVFDLGVSSRQLDDAERGFSFTRSGRLDMRMAKEGLCAHDIVNGWTLSALIGVFKRGGEHKFAKPIAHAILKARNITMIDDTKTLADIVSATIPRKFHKIGKHPATLTFQALRIEVNQELIALKQGLHEADSLLAKDGLLLSVGFHSLEDKIIARHLRGAGGVSRHLPDDDADKSLYRLVTKSAILPDRQEIEDNPRARSARLRVGIKL